MPLDTTRTQSALVVIDVQNDVMAGAYRESEVIAVIKQLVERARACATPIIWVQHSDEELLLNSPGWEIVSELQPRDGELRIYKTLRSAFYETELESALERLNTKHLLVCGAQTNNCVRHTSHTALDRGYDVTLIQDAHTTTGYEWNDHVIDAENVVNEQNDNFSGLDLPHARARVIASTDIKFD